MTRMLAVAHRVLLQFLHDKRTLALLFVAPLVVLWLLSVLLGSEAYEPRIAAVTLPAQYQSALEQQDARVSDVNATQAEDMLRKDDVDAILRMKTGSTLEIRAEGSDSTKTAAVASVASKALASMQTKASERMKRDISDKTANLHELFAKLRQRGLLTSAVPNLSIDPTQYMPIQSIDTTYLHGNSSWRMFDFYGPVFIGIFLFMFTFITSGMSLVSERTSGTMARFLATPVKPVQIVGGYSLGFAVLTSAQVVVILVATLEFIGFPNVGNVLLVWLTAVSLTLVSVTLGLLVSGLARSGFQVIQLILLFVVPQILLCGLFDLSTAPQWMMVLSRCLPLTYGVDALRAVMLRGAGMDVISVDLAVVWGFMVLFFVLAALRLRKKKARKSKALGNA